MNEVKKKKKRMTFLKVKKENEDTGRLEKKKMQKVLSP